MNKLKIEKILLLVLLPIFILALVFRFIGRIKQRPPATPVAVSRVEEKEEYIKEEAKVLEKLKKVEYKAGDFLDPLRNRLSIYIASIAPKVKREKPIAIKPPQFNITGLIWNSDRPQAIVDGNVLSVGDEIKGAKLLSVNKDGIRIQYEGAEFFIKK